MTDEERIQYIKEHIGAMVGIIKAKIDDAEKEMQTASVISNTYYQATKNAYSNCLKMLEEIDQI